MNTIYYSVSNGGDGSAYPMFFATATAADIHQAIVNAYEGWGEDCVGSVDFAGSVECLDLYDMEVLAVNFVEQFYNIVPNEGDATMRKWVDFLIENISNDESIALLRDRSDEAQKRI
jgi:hypothetical protein